VAVKVARRQGGLKYKGGEQKKRKMNTKQEWKDSRVETNRIFVTSQSEIAQELVSQFLSFWNTADSATAVDVIEKQDRTRFFVDFGFVFQIGALDGFVIGSQIHFERAEGLEHINSGRH
jgi:hypothetical protein